MLVLELSSSFSVIYGGNGMFPNSSKISSNIPLYSNLTILAPSSPIPTTSAINFPSPNENLAPIFAILPGLTSVSQVSSSVLFKSKNSIFPPVSTFEPISLAGITLVSMKNYF